MYVCECVWVCMSVCECVCMSVCLKVSRNCISPSHQTFLHSFLWCLISKCRWYVTFPLSVLLFIFSYLNQIQSTYIVQTCNKMWNLAILYLTVSLKKPYAIRETSRAGGYRHKYTLPLQGMYLYLYGHFLAVHIPFIDQKVVGNQTV